MRVCVAYICMCTDGYTYVRVSDPSRRSSSFQVRIVFMHYVNIGTHVRRPTRISIFFPKSFVADYAAATTHRHDEIALIFAILVIHYYYLHTQRQRHTKSVREKIPAGKPCLPPHIHDIKRRGCWKRHDEEGQRPHPLRRVG